MKILHIDTSITGKASVSRQVSSRIINLLRATEPRAQIVQRDLDAEPLPHLDSKVLAAAAPGARPDGRTKKELARNAAVLEEFLSADVIVIGAPMYNFGIPSQLKAWIDRVLIAGKTFRYTANGPEGLAGGKRVIVASARGGFYGAGTPQAAYDFQENYLRAAFGLAGITDVEFVRAEGVNVGPAQREQAMTSAFESAAALTSPLAPARAA